MKPNLMHFFRRYYGWVIALAIIGYAVANNANSYPKANGNTIVHKTTYGHKYHRVGCRYLSKSDYEIKLSDAVAEGLTPCSVCKPPILDDGK